jgi:methylenetetrahydrofolate reductase (NADPH)
MRETSTDRTVRRLLDNVRYEVLPTPTAEDKVVQHLPPDRVVTITSSPSKGLEATLELAERLAGHGYGVVPHLAARMISGRPELADIVDRLAACGVTRIFVPAGDAEPAGVYRDALALLEDLAFLGAPFAQIGITGYPESHPRIHDDLTIQSMWDKRLHATQIVSNLTFDAAIVASWITRMRARGVAVPVLLGIPGPVERSKLLAMATKIGVGESTRFLAKNKGLFARLAAPGGFTGERFLRECGDALRDEAAGVEGLHVYTFNQIAETEAWRAGLLDRLAP